MKYILTGGGTGGHVYPALSIAEKIKQKEPDAKFLYMGSKDHIESSIVPRKGYRIKYIKAVGMPSKKFSAEMAFFFLIMIAGTLRSLVTILSFRPDMIIGTGGFVSAPPVLAGIILRKLKLSRTKLFLHEANAEPGKMIKKLGPKCDGVGVSYPVSLKYFTKNGKFVGYPVRPELYEGSREGSRKILGIDMSDFVVFIVGGSQGARTLNRAAVDSLIHLKGIKNLRMIHVTGKGTPGYKGALDTVKRFERNRIKKEDFPFYQNLKYADNIKDYYYSSDLIISRGGGSINEIAVCRIPSVIIPKANLSGDHQVMNAQAMKDAGASEIIFEEAMIEDDELVIKVCGEELAEKIKELYSDSEKLSEMRSAASDFIRSDANKNIYSFIKGILTGKITEKPEITETSKNPFADMTIAGIHSILSSSAEGDISPEHMDYIRYRASHALVSGSWERRNCAVKVIAETGSKKMVPFLSRMFANDKVPFIRRNIISAYGSLKIYNETVEKDIMTALSDPYWEIRVEALKLVKIFETKTSMNEKIRPIVEGLLENGNFEEILEAVPAYSVFINSIEDLKPVSKFYCHGNALIRKKIIDIFEYLKTSENSIDKDDIEKEMEKVMLISSTI